MRRETILPWLNLGLLSEGVLSQSQNQDQINNFCRRFAHQTTFIDNKLYVDGGFINYGGQIDGSTVNYTNTELLWADTSTVNSNLFPQMYNNLSKPANVPSVAGGTLWPDTVNKLFYLFGGQYNQTSSPPASYTLWFFDTIYNTWNTTSADSSQSGISPPAFGASAVDQNRGTAYYYGGWSSNATQAGFSGSPQLQTDLVQYDLTHNQWRQSTFIDGTPRGEGALFYIPVSDAGMLVYIGGVVQTSNTTSGTTPANSTTGNPMDTIWLYDIGSQQSYSQKTSGTPPGMRRKFCGGVSWPDDRSSYDIYLYGGLPPYDQEGLGYGDAWILSIPSFTWTVLYNSTVGPHHSLSCNVINEGQMMIMGGYFPNSSDTNCDIPAIWGMHNMNLGSNNVLDATWYQFLPNITEYTLPPNLTAVVGGSATGGATLTTPSGGFDSDQLSTLMGRKAPEGQRNATRAIPSPTSSSSSKSGSGGGSNAGAIAGGVVGGVAGLALILGLVWFCLRRRKRQQAAAQAKATQNDPDPDPAQTQMAESSTVGAPSDYGGSPNPNHKRDFSGNSWTTSSYGGSPETSPHPPQINWQPVPMAQQMNAQQYYAPPPQTQQYYPPPPVPQQHGQEEQILADPAFEMPSVRSPTNVEDVFPPAFRSSVTPLGKKPGDTIHEE